MQSVWDRSVLPHEKVKLFTEELNKFKSLLKTMVEPLKVQIQQQDVQQTPSINSNNEISMKKSYENDETIIQGLAKANRKKGIVLLDFLKMHPDRIMWNGKGEMIYQGKTFYGSNISHLISDVIANRKKPLSQTFHGSAFVKALPDLDVPKDLVRNTSHLQMLEVYKTEKPHTMSSERKRKWLSSFYFWLYSRKILFFFLIQLFACNYVGHTS